MDLESLSAIAAYSAQQNLEDSQRMARLFRGLYFFPKPIIAAVNGPAIAGGTGLATMCDFTLAVPEARFGYTEVKIGFIPALVSIFLRRQIGEKRSRELLLTGRIFDAAEAHALGLVNEIVPAEKLMARANELAASLITASPTSLLRTKLLLRRCAEVEIDREIELAVQENAAIRSTKDFKEGLAAFLEKRSPKWSGE
jgi:methylglutaconyl-CoA hydratase